MPICNPKALRLRSVAAHRLQVFVAKCSPHLTPGSLPTLLMRMAGQGPSSHHKAVASCQPSSGFAPPVWSTTRRQSPLRLSACTSTGCWRSVVSVVSVVGANHCQVPDVVRPDVSSNRRPFPAACKVAAPALEAAGSNQLQQFSHMEVIP